MGVGNELVLEGGDASHPGMMQRPSGIVCSLVAPVQPPRCRAPQARAHSMGAMAHVGCHWRASKVQKAGPSSVWWCQPDGSRRVAT